MKKILILLALSLLFTWPALAAEPAAPQKIPRLFGRFNPKVGVWSEYAIIDKASGRRSTMKMAIVGQEEGRYWYEVANEEEGGRNIVKMLVSGDPNDPENIQRLILKSGNNPSQEMPRDFVLVGRRMAAHMFEQRSGVPVTPAADLRLEQTGTGTVSVPAGTFEITRNRIVDAKAKSFGTYNFSPEILPLGLFRQIRKIPPWNLSLMASTPKPRSPKSLLFCNSLRVCPKGCREAIRPDWARMCSRVVLSQGRRGRDLPALRRG